jgi:Flp pilus assembly protein TadG
MKRVFTRFLKDRGGNFAMMSIALSLPLVLGVGLSIDYTRHSSAQRHLQELADAASLTLAASKEQNEGKLRTMAEDIIAANRDPGRLQRATIASIETDADKVDVTLDGEIPATFMSIAGYDRLLTSASALAERAVMGNVEVALILDNTWSMSDKGPSGATKIATLKTAATKLVNELLQTQDGAVRMGLVPYADYVNVGLKYRNASWLDVPADYNRPKTDPVCNGTKTETSRACVRENPRKTCTRTNDGITESYSCSGGCAEYGPETTRTVPNCTGGQSAASFKWFGCVGSRMPSDSRLHDKSPNVRYPGYLDQSQRCLNPLVTLTSDKTALLSAINGMIINIGTGYLPNTYIPAGLTWGLNVLNPGEPFADAAAYDPANAKPRKVAVLMTDGENTLKFSSSDGRHIKFSGDVKTDDGRKKQAADRAVTDADTLKLCTYMKQQGIEIYSVAFMVENATAKKMLEDCATDAQHYYDASDNESLLAAFAGIGQSLRVVRLAR